MSDPIYGIRKKSFAMYFGGGEIWFEHLDGIHDETTAAVEKLNGDATRFSRPSSPSLMAINLDETTLTDPLLDAVCDALRNPRKRPTRVAFVGAGRAKRKILHRIKGETFAVFFTDDFEKAKEWLVSEGE